MKFQPSPWKGSSCGRGARAKTLRAARSREGNRDAAELYVEIAEWLSLDENRRGVMGHPIVTGKRRLLRDMQAVAVLEDFLECVGHGICESGAAEEDKIARDRVTLKSNAAGAA